MDDAREDDVNEDDARGNDAHTENASADDAHEDDHDHMDIVCHKRVMNGSHNCSTICSHEALMELFNLVSHHEIHRHHRDSDNKSTKSSANYILFV